MTSARRIKSQGAAPISEFELTAGDAPANSSRPDAGALRGLGGAVLKAGSPVAADIVGIPPFFGPPSRENRPQSAQPVGAWTPVTAGP